MNEPRFDGLVFLDEKKRAEWENLDPDVKKFVTENIHATTEKLETKMAVEVICNVLGDLFARMERMEKILSERSENRL